MKKQVQRKTYNETYKKIRARSKKTAINSAQMSIRTGFGTIFFKLQFDEDLIFKYQLDIF